MKKIIPLMLFVTALGGCGEAEPDPEPGASTGSSLAESYWNDKPAADPMSVLEAQEAAADRESITVIGRVSEFVASRAQFQLTDGSFTPCNEEEGDSCETPWDYCCVEPDVLARGTLVVEFRENDQLVKAGLKGFHGFDHLKQVVVTGRPKKDEAGNLTLVAAAIHVAP